MSAPADHDARTRATERTHLSVAVSAGAGSGKTSVLVDRVVNVLVQGTPPERVAVITFTVKAAGELIARVRDALEAAYARAEGQRRATLGRVLETLPRLTLSTIHAFCGELLRGEALAAGWAPGTEVLGEIYAPSAVQAGFVAWRADFMRRHPELYVRLLRELDVTDHKLEKAALCLLEHRDLLPALGRLDPDLRPARARLDALAAELAATVARCTNPGACKLLDKNRTLLEGLAAIRDLPDHEALPRVMALGEGSKQGGAARDWPDRGHERLKELIDALRAWRTETEPLLLEPIHHALVADLATHFLPAVAEEKAASAQVDFQDLLFATLELLTRDAAASRRLARRFDAILVDEVQDTDPIQSAIVMKLARVYDHPHDAPWHGSAPRPGGVFAVGDRAQSIYRFRRADVAQWTRLTELIAQGGLHESFVANFRSVPGIVGFVNAAFGHDRAFATQRAMREPASLDPVVMLVADDGIDRSVARYLHHVRRDGVVVDRHTRAPRSVRWRDIMVLVPAWTRADELAATLLTAGVPAVVEGGRTFFDRDEVRLAIAALNAFEEPGHAEAIVFALRGLFGISLDELARHRAAGGRWSLTQTDQPPGAAADALAALRKIAARRGQVSWVTLLDDVLEATGAPAVWSLLSRGPSMLANVDKLRALIREIEAHTLSGGEVIARLTTMARSQVKDEEDLPLAGADSDVVRITSYFKAKGLEAPIVVLPHLVRRTDPVEHVVDRDAERLLLKVGKLVPAGWPEARAREEAERAEERRRWLYVAATRARDQLVVVRTDSDPLLEPDLASALPDPALPDDAVAEVAPAVMVRVRHASLLHPLGGDESTFPGHDGAVDHLLAAEDTPRSDPAPAWQAVRARMIATAKRRSRRWRAVTTHAASARRRASSRGTSRDGRAIGQAVHRAMQELDLALEREPRAAQAAGLARAFAGELGLGSDSVENAATIAARLAQDPIVERARAAPEVWREVPFVARDGAELVSGRIDLVFPTDATRTRWVVVDWKSELPPPGDPRRATYEAQLEGYARALIGAVGPHPVAIDKVLVGPPPELAASPEDAWRIAEDEVAEALAPLLATLRAAGAPAPEVGLEIGEPAIASDVELVWEEALICLAIDPPEDELAALGAAGWQVFTWPVETDARREVMRALALALGLTLTQGDEETIA